MRHYFAKIVDDRNRVIGLLSDIKIYEDGSYRFADIAIDSSHYNPETPLTIYIQKDDVHLPFNTKDYECVHRPNGPVVIKGTLYEVEGEYI